MKDGHSFQEDLLKGCTMNTNRKGIKGFLLAAGYGKRLLPLTKIIPKPLILFQKTPVIEHALRIFKKNDIEDVGINTHHLHNKISLYIKNQDILKKIFVSYEENKILGTGGALSALDKWRKSSTLVVMNADVVHNYCLKKIIDLHFDSQNIATMALREKPLYGETPIWCSNKQVLAIGGKKPSQQAKARGFACIQVLSDKFIKQIPKNTFSCIIKTYQNQLKNNERVGFYLSNDFWYDLGTLDSLVNAHCHEKKISIKKIEDSILNCRHKSLPFYNDGFRKCLSEMLNEAQNP